MVKSLVPYQTSRNISIFFLHLHHLLLLLRDLHFHYLFEQLSNREWQCLLFYTDGMTVYNKNHVIMPNGNFLTGHSSSSQSGVIVKKPGSSLPPELQAKIEMLPARDKQQLLKML